MEENNKIPIYTDNDGLTKIDVKLEEDTLWLTQAQMCELYQTSKSNVSEYIKHIFEEGELQEDSVVRKFRTTATDGKSYMTTFYNLDMIIALLDFAERQAEKEQPMTMNDWANYGSHTHLNWKTTPTGWRPSIPSRSDGSCRY